MIACGAEVEGEKTDDIAMGVMSNPLGLLDVTLRSHRIGQKANERRNLRSNTSTPPRPRPIIVRFANRNPRHKVFENKKKKSISESLTKARLEFLNADVVKYGRDNVCSNECFIMTKVDGR